MHCNVWSVLSAEEELTYLHLEIQQNMKFDQTSGEHADYTQRGPWLPSQGNQTQALFAVMQQRYPLHHCAAHLYKNNSKQK